MSTITIIPTQNQAIIKFQLDEFIVKNKTYEYKNIDETATSPLARKLFYFPFVKTVYIASNFIAIEKYSIVTWDDVQAEVADTIKHYVDSGEAILTLTETVAKQPVTVYAETTPNPAVQKFVANKLLTSFPAEYKNIEEAQSSPLATALYQFPFVKEVFIDENYISITKYNVIDWNEVTLEIRTFIKNYLEEGKTIINANSDQSTPEAVLTDTEFEKLDVTSQQIINILEEYVKPAVAGDGGNIKFINYDASTKQVTVLLQGACSGCPSSIFTLKNGIENILQQMLNDSQITVVAQNT